MSLKDRTIRRGFSGILVTSVLAGALSCSPPETGPGAEDAAGALFAPDRVLVKFRPAVDESVRQASARALGVLGAGHPGEDRARLLYLGAGMSVREALRALAADLVVEYAEPDWRIIPLGPDGPLEQLSRAVPSNPLFPRQWHLDRSPVFSFRIAGRNFPVDPDMDAPEGWSLLGTAWGGTGSATVGVLDSGCGTGGFFDASGYHSGHEDLPSSRLYRNQAEAVNGFDDDGNGYADDVNGWDWIEGDDAPADDSAGGGHGTFVSGLIAASWDNGLGVAGAGRDRLSLLPLRGAFVSDMVAAVDYAVELRAAFARVRVLNASWKIPDASNALREAIVRAGDGGILLVAAAGNDGADNDALPVYPASWSLTLSNVLAAAAADSAGRLADFSNRGLSSVQIAAPGEDIISTYTGSDGYGRGSGTSFAAPLVSAAAALLFAAQPGMTVEQAVARLLAGGDFDERLLDRVAVSRRVDLDGALAPFHPVSGWCYLDSTAPISFRADDLAAAFGTPVAGGSADPSVAALAGGGGSGWAVSPVSPGVAELVFFFDSSAPAGSLRAGPWRVAAVRPFTRRMSVGETVAFAAIGSPGGVLTWAVEDADGTGAGIIGPASGLFTARALGTARVVLSRDGSPWDVSGPISVVNLPPTVTITGGPAGAVADTTVTFTWRGRDQDGSVAGYYTALDEEAPTAWTTSTAQTFSGVALGVHVFRVRAVDDFGASSAVVSRSFTVGEGDAPKDDDRCFFSMLLGSGGAAVVQITALRDFRDHYLAACAPGRALVRAYYRWSPAVCRAWRWMAG